MKVKIKKWAAVATWRWDIPEDDVCGICQIHFDGSCPSCSFPGDDCPLPDTIRTYVQSPGNAATTSISIASCSGLSKKLQEDSVLCVARVCTLDAALRFNRL
ncbi:ubiquitin-protein ligase Anaphase Promoting Complex [Gnomoniopsis sp. IMI 355080]|nr:ubiquitin-protein ligase Anaphase Promoting Complex [Gnomoniopsis sp. IMI 355080]